MSDHRSDRGILKTKAFPGSSVAQVVETGVGDCAIESVVVYQDRAEVKRAVPVHLAPGENEVIVYDLAECVDKNSIRCVDLHSTIIFHNFHGHSVVFYFTKCLLFQ